MLRILCHPLWWAFIIIGVMLNYPEFVSWFAAIIFWLPWVVCFVQLEWPPATWRWSMSHLSWRHHISRGWTWKWLWCNGRIRIKLPKYPRDWAEFSIISPISITISIYTYNRNNFNSYESSIFYNTLLYLRNSTSSPMA